MRSDTVCVLHNAMLLCVLQHSNAVEVRLSWHNVSDTTSVSTSTVDHHLRVGVHAFLRLKNTSDLCVLTALELIIQPPFRSVKHL